jgi:integrase
MKKRLPLKTNAKIKDVFDYYLNSPEFCRLKAQTQKDYENHLIKASQTIIGTKKLGEYNNQRLNVRMCTDAYEQWLQVGVRTANYRKAAFSSAWKHAMRDDVMVHHPMHVVKTVANEPRRKTWSKSDVKSFLDVAYSDFRYRSIGLIVHMSYEWGQRVGDMRLLKWESLDLQRSVVSFTQSKRNASVILPIGPNLCKMLQVQKDTYDFQEYVTPRIKAQAGGFSPYNKYEVSKLINDLLDEANLDPNLTAMDLRRTAVTEMLEGGVDMAVIMQVTGHKNINSVKPYMVNTLRGASKALSARGNDDDE